MLVLAVVELWKLNASEGNYDVDDRIAEWTDMLYAACSLAYIILFPLSAILFIRWFYRAYRNLSRLPVRRRRHPWWTIAAWFVPLANLFLPYQIAKELFVKSEYLLARGSREPDTTANYEIVGLWWGIWVFFLITARFAARFEHRISTLDDMRVSYQLDLVVDVLGIAAGLLAIRVVRNYAAMEAELRRVYSPDKELILESFGGR